MKPLTNQRRQTPAASSAQFLHRASMPHAEIGEKICNRCVIIFRGARNYFLLRRPVALAPQATGKYPRNLIRPIFLSCIFLFSRDGSQKRGADAE
jgi:hypothetical protein